MSANSVALTLRKAGAASRSGSRPVRRLSQQRDADREDKMDSESFSSSQVSSVGGGEHETDGDDDNDDADTSDDEMSP